MLSCKFYEISKNTFFYRTPAVAASTNRGYLHCAILKALHGFQEKRALKSRDMKFFLQNAPNEIFKIFKMFQSNMKFTRTACWINSATETKSPHSYFNYLIFLFCHYCVSYLLLQLKPWGVRGASHRLTFMSDRRTISHMFYSPIYPLDEGNKNVGMI